MASWREKNLFGQYLKNFDSRELKRVETEYLVVGGGIAGLFTAWSAYQQGAKVTIITKQSIIDSNTDKAQGGIAAAIGKHDSPEIHMQDTLVAGAGLCNESAVKMLVTEGVDRIEELIKIGVNFDQGVDGIALAWEGCHSRARVLHANGDSTGAEVIRGLREKIAKTPEITIMEYQVLVDLLVEDNTCYGALVFDSQSQTFHIFQSKVVVLATGGIGQLYKHTTNPEVATADGIAAAWRAGAEIMDMEFVQFHPTALALTGMPSFLISEAVRGEGAILRNIHHERFMPNYHEMAELAPRDVVSKAIFNEMTNTASHHVLLDITHLDSQRIKDRFPMIVATCLRYGLDITRQLIPVAPAAHYMMGGIKINMWGETSIEGLFCCGESSCIGVHGANRLASNSLLEGLVISERVARRYASLKEIRKQKQRIFSNHQLKIATSYDYEELRSSVKNIMEKKVGLLRTAEGLSEALDWFEQWERLFDYEVNNVMEIEVRNMLTVGKLVAEAAILRTESRGGHFRQDYPYTVAGWCKHILLKSS
ncbi:MAG: L-aspartate oxidase [Firmicutes bacterium]|nr:L-aspartate oxidase [Bacillota bacterium]